MLWETGFRKSHYSSIAAGQGGIASGAMPGEYKKIDKLQAYANMRPDAPGVDLSSICLPDFGPGEVIIEGVQ